MLLKNIKTRFTVFLLGERHISNSLEVDYHNITTIYNELLQLSNNNNVVDLTIQNIYDNMDYEIWNRDMSYIHNAEYNVGVGEGGNFVTCISFAKSTIYYVENLSIGNLNKTKLYSNNHYVFTELDEFASKLDVLT
jgi:hypothetical protein